MRCCNQNNEAKVTDAVLEFKRDQLLYDIKNYLFIEGSIMTESPDHVRHTVQDVGEEGNVDRVTRLLWLLHGLATEMLYPYSKRDIEMDILDDDLEEPPVYEIEMKMPEGFSQTTLDLLERLIHEWMVCRVVMDWLSITHPEKSVIWEGKAEALEGKIRRSLNARTGRTRIKLHPF